MKLFSACVLAAQLLATCAGPPYERPDAALPPVYPEAAASPASAQSMGDLGWWQVFQDPVLQQLLRTAVAQNQDVLVAAQRIQQAQAELTIAGAARFPQINAVLSAPYQRTNGTIPATTPRSTFAPNGLLTLSYEVDLFGKVSSATAAARATVLQTEFTRETVLSTLVASVATLYFQLRELDDELVVSQQTLAARKTSLDLVTARLTGGIGTLQDVRQAQELVAQVEAAIPQLRSGIKQTENAIAVLEGGYPHAVERGYGLRRQIAMPAVPAAGLPSSLIERRPDIKASEAALIAANAQIGEARALLFPQFTISASAGAASAQAVTQGIGPLPSAVTTYGQGFISIVPQIVQQIFNAGAVRANVALSEAGKEAATLQYIETIHQDVEDVSNALVSYDEGRRTTAAQTAATAAAVDATRLASMRFEGGVTSYLEVLVSETQSYAAEISLIQAQYDERASLIQLYKALGGGWQPEPVSSK